MMLLEAMMMFKRFRLGLVLLLAAALLAGCAGNSGNASSISDNQPHLNPDEPVALTIWHYYNGIQKRTLDEFVTEFNETVGMEKGIVVEAVGQGDVEDLIKKAVDAANKKVGAEELPNIFSAYADTAFQVDQLGLVAELSQYMTQEEINAFVPSYVDEGRLSGSGLKIFPTAKSTEIMMLNKTDWDKFAAATGADINSLQTMESLVETAKLYYEWTDSLTQTPNDGKAMFGRDAVANYFIIGCKQLGVEIFSVKDGKVTLNLKKDVLKKLWDCLYVSGYFGAYGRFRTDDVKTGDLIALVGSTSGSTYFPDKVMINDTESYPIEVAVYPAPLFQDAQPYAVQQGAGMVVTKSTATAEYASVVFLEWFTEKQRNIDFSIRTGYLPSKKDANDIDLINKRVESLNLSSETLKKTLQVGVQTVNTHSMYTNRAFQGGTAARQVLESSMMQKAKADRKSVEEMIQKGKTHAQAVEQFATQENFEAWYVSFEAALIDATK